MKPSDIPYDRWPPLTGCFGRVEREAAALYMLIAMRAAGDEFKAVAPVDIVRAAGNAGDKDEYLRKIITNPFFKPEPWDLVEKGFAYFTGEAERSGGKPVMFTTKGLDALKKWADRYS